MRRILIALIELITMFAVFTVCNKAGLIKYILVTAVALGFMVLGRKRKCKIESLFMVSFPAVVYLTIGCLCSLFTANIYSETIKIVLFWTIPLLFSFALYVFSGEDMPRIIDIEFFASALVYLITTARFLWNYYNSESMFAYAYGAFLVYYVSKKRWKMCAIAAILVWLADKRIVFVATFMAVFVQGVLWLFRNDKRMVQGLWTIVALVSNVYLWLIYSGTLEAFCKGVGINTNGRVKMFGQVAEWFGGDFFSIGHGIGVVEEVLSAWNIRKFLNLHNDLLKFHIELGFVGLMLYFISFAVVFYLIAKRYGNKKAGLFVSMAIYMIVLFATDNVSIYIIFLLPLYSIFFAVLVENENEVIKQND